VTITRKLEIVENALGLLNAAFAHLYKLHPTCDEKQNPQVVVDTLMKYWRNRLKLSVY